MPKYNPNKEDMYKVTPCAVCGQDAIDSETCSDICAQAYEAFKEDFEQDLINNMEE